MEDDEAEKVKKEDDDRKELYALTKEGLQEDAKTHIEGIIKLHEHRIFQGKVEIGG